LTFDRPLDEGEPKGLDAAVYQRIKELKWSKKHQPAGSYQHKNINAVLEAYRNGEFKWNPDSPPTSWIAKESSVST
jgi:Leu/Phe-tRNA-protein transferase